MLIHSVTPPHMLMEQSDLPERSVRQIDGGYLEGYETPQGFCMSRLLSTDPQAYLKKEYTPGDIYGGR